MSRAGYLDAARGIGIVLVLAGHMFAYGEMISCAIFAFHVPLFFFLSGAVRRVREDGTGAGETGASETGGGTGGASETGGGTGVGSPFHFRWNGEPTPVPPLAFRKLILPYVKYCLAGLLVTALLPWLRESLAAPDRVLKDLYRAAPERLHVGPVWFLFCLFWVELGFSLYRRILPGESTERQGIAGALTAYGIPAASLLAGMTVIPAAAAHFPYGRMPLQIDTAFAAFGFYAAGYLAGPLIRDAASGKYRTGVLRMIAACGLLMVCVSGWVNGWVNISLLRFGNPVYYVAFAAAGIALAAVQGILTENGRYLQFLGRNSMMIFALHPLFNQGYYWLLSFCGYRYPDDLTNRQAVFGTVYSLAVMSLLAWGRGRVRVLKNSRRGSRNNT